METTRCALIVLLSASLWRESYTSSIQLCTDSPTSFENGTAIPAILGKPVSVVFCVQCQPLLYISPYIQIKHPNHPRGPYYYYTNNEPGSGPVIVNITSSANKATINITINIVQKEDFTDHFSVRVITNRGVNDNSVFVFYLSDASTSDTTTSDVSPIFTTTTKRPAVTSIGTSQASSSTELSTVTSQASTATASTSSPTQEITQCWPNKTSLCPENWYQVDNETCLLVILVSNSALPRTVCNRRDSEPVKGINIKNLRSCLIKILGESKEVSNNDVVRLDRTHYVNVQSGTEVTGTGTYSVVCVNKPPTISLFKLEIYNRTGWSLVDNSTDNVIVNTTYAAVSATCKAQGVPTPRVIVTAEGELKPYLKMTDASRNQSTYEALFRLADCSRAGVYTCTANNSLGTTQAQRRIRFMSSLKVKVSQFTANNKKRTSEIRPGNTVELKCSVDGCPDRVTITRNEHPIAETANYTVPLVHKIPGVNCSHMGTYTCLAKSQTGQDVQETADLEVKGCPVSLCENKDASREMSPILGGNVTFSLCLLSSEGLKFSANEIKIVVTFTRNPMTRFYWTVNITMYNIKVNDYRTHTVRIGNSYGSMDIDFTLKNGDASNRTFEFESNTLLVALPPICFTIIVFIIAGIVWCRVKGTLSARSRAEETGARGDGSEDTKGGLYENISTDLLPSAEYEEAAGMRYESIILNTDGMGDLAKAEYVEIDDVQHETPVTSVDRQKLTSRVHNSEAEYANTSTHV